MITSEIILCSSIEAGDESKRKTIGLCVHIVLLSKRIPMIFKSRGFFGRGRKIRTLKNGFGDRYVTITSCPFGQRAYYNIRNARLSIISMLLVSYLCMCIS